jgi:hypothetical protein
LSTQIDAAKHILQPEQMAERMAGLAKRGGALPTVGNDGDVNSLNGVSKYIYVKVSTLLPASLLQNSLSPRASSR